MAKKYNFSDHFEMLYLRHGYLTKVENLADIDINPYRALTELTARNMFKKLNVQFTRVGFEEEDIISISYVYLTAFLGLYSHNASQENYDKMLNQYNRKNEDIGYIPQKELARLERNNIINFLRQKLFHCAEVCSRKSRNITVGRDIKMAFAETANSLRASEDLLIKEYKSFNYRKVSAKELKEIKADARINGSKELFDKDGFRIIEIVRLDLGIRSLEYSDIISTYSGIHYSTPDEILEQKENNLELLMAREKFDNFSNKKKKQVLSRFIEENKDTSNLSTELKLARKLLKQYRAEDSELRRLKKVSN